MSFRTRWDDWKPPSSPRVVGEVSGAFYEVNPQEGGQSFADGPLKDPTTPTTSPSPTDQLDRKWATALRQVRAAFGEQRVRPSQGTLECAAGIEMELDRGWPDK